MIQKLCANKPFNSCAVPVCDIAHFFFKVCAIANSFFFIHHSEKKRDSAISNTGTAHRTSRWNRARIKLADNSSDLERKTISVNVDQMKNRLPRLLQVW